MTQQKLHFRGSRTSFADKLRDYDTRNLDCARIVLANRRQYEKPGYGCAVIWAQMVIARLGTLAEREQVA